MIDDVPTMCFHHSKSYSFLQIADNVLHHQTLIPNTSYVIMKCNHRGRTG